MTVSMTGFAAAKGHGAGHSWSWDLRSVNGKGLDLRLRVPEWIDGLEPALRAELSRALQRGNVSLALKVMRDGSDGTDTRINTTALAGVLAALHQVEQAAMEAGVTLGGDPPGPMFWPVWRDGGECCRNRHGGVASGDLGDLSALIAAFTAMRQAEGQALNAVVAAQLAMIGNLVADGLREAEARRSVSATNLRDALRRVLDNVDGLDEQRLAQEFALAGGKERCDRGVGPAFGPYRCRRFLACRQRTGWPEV